MQRAWPITPSKRHDTLSTTPWEAPCWLLDVTDPLGALSVHRSVAYQKSVHHQKASGRSSSSNVQQYYYHEGRRARLPLAMR